MHSVFGRVIHDYLSHELSWSKVTAVLVILAEISTEADEEDLQATAELLAESISKLGGMVSFNTIIPFSVTKNGAIPVNTTARTENKDIRVINLYLSDMMDNQK